MRKILSLLLVVVLTMSTLGTMVFASETVTYGRMLKELGVINGDATGNLNGDKELTRGELIAIISTLTTPKVDDFKSPGKASFTDVPTTHWAFKHIERAKASGISNGLGNGKFGVNDKVTYKQAKAFMLNVLEYKDVAWDKIDAEAHDVGLYSQFAVDSPKFTRDMMFELLFSTLTSYKLDGEIFFETVRNNTNLNWVAEDLDYIWETYDEINYGYGGLGDASNDSANTELVDMSKYKFNTPLTALTNEEQKTFGTYMSLMYAEILNGVEFKTSSLENLLQKITIIYDEKDSIGLFYNVANDADNFSYDYFILNIDKTGTIKSVFDSSDKEGSKPSGHSYLVESVYESKNSVMTSDGYTVTGYVVDMVETNTKEHVKLVVTLTEDGFINSGYLLGTGLNAIVF